MAMPYSIIGNTSDFGSEITGSSPVRVTINNDFIIMDRKEYLNKIAELNHQIRMLKDDYITSNCNIPAGSYVIVTCEGKDTRAYLKEYKIVDGYIKPIFNACLESGRGCAAYVLPEFPGNITMRLA